MLAPIKPDTLLLKFLFTAPCLLAMLTITCQQDTERETSASRPEGPAAETEPAATLRAA